MGYNKTFANSVTALLLFSFFIGTFSIAHKCSYEQNQSATQNQHQYQCPVNSYCQKNGFCQCNEGYFGNCKLNGKKLVKQEKHLIPAACKHSYFIINPKKQATVGYKFIFCSESIQPQIQQLNIWLDDGTLQEPILQNSVSIEKISRKQDSQSQGSQICVSEFITNVFSFQNKENQKSQNIIVGIRLKETNQLVYLYYTQNQVYLYQIILQVIGILLLGTFTFVVGAYFLDSQARKIKNRTKTSCAIQLNDISYFNEYFPQQICDQSLQGKQCMISLDQLVVKDKIRKLTCGHIFHTNCIDEWCKQHKLICPTCKISLQKQTLLSSGISKKQLSQLNTTKDEDITSSKQILNHTL